MARHLGRQAPAAARARRGGAALRGLGYRIEQARLERDGRQRLWRCFVAERDGTRLRVCERIVDAEGRAWTDASSWFWAAQLGQSSGPWQAVTTARPL